MTMTYSAALNRSHHGVRMVWPNGDYEIAEFKSRWLAELFLAMLAYGELVGTEYDGVCRAKLIRLNPPPFSIN